MTQARLSPEASYLLEVTQDGCGPLPAFQSDETNDPTSAQLIKLAHQHQVGPLIHWVLLRRKKQNPQEHKSGLPIQAADEFRLAYAYHLMRNEHLVHFLEELSQALQSKGIQSIIFKGPWLAFSAYPDPGARPMDDIDLGIQEKDYLVAVEILKELGYSPDVTLPADSSQAIRRAHYGTQIRFAARGRRPIELHFRMINMGPPSAKEDWLWDNRVDMKIGATIIQVPGPEAMLLHLCLHANQHSYSVLRLLFDIKFALTAITNNLDIHRFINLVNLHRCKTAVYHSLLLARDMTGAKVPNKIFNELRPWPLRRRIFCRVWDIPRVRCLVAKRRSNSLESPLLYFFEMGSFWGKARYLSGIIKESGGPLSFARTAIGASFGKRK
ncbi:MAG: nucleotidyltransferase family protein [Planctomycetes bacterium]|nr:nucleotidyltransferase family protein [Planctomycetota bacterium]